MEIQAIKKYMKDNHITYDELAQRSGLSISTIKKIFSGISQYPRIDTMQAIEAALELNASPLQWTDEEKAAGVGAHGTKLSNEEWDWLELRSAIIEAKGEKGLHAILTIIQTYLDSK